MFLAKFCESWLRNKQHSKRLLFDCYLQKKTARFMFQLNKLTVTLFIECSGSFDSDTVIRDQFVPRNVI